MDLNYTILFDNGTTASIPLQDMVSLIPPCPVGPLLGDSSSSQDSLLPPFLHVNSKITYEHDGQYHKGFLTKCDGTYCFSIKLHVNKCSEDWGVDLPNLANNWIDLCVKGLSLVMHLTHLFVPCHPQLQQHLTWSPPLSALLTFTSNAHPPSLKALPISTLTRKVWLNSFSEEKQGIESLGTFCKIMLGEY
jgi:hypothetical protein